MNQTNEAVPHVTQSTDAERKAKIEQELRLAKEYWLESIQPFVKERIPRDVELFVARHAHNNLQVAIKSAENWNQGCNATRDGSRWPAYIVYSHQIPR